MSRVTVMFELDDAVLQRLQGIAREASTDVGALVRRAIDEDLVRRSHSPAVGPSEPAPIEQLAADLNAARTWGDLRARLAARGVTLRRREGSLALVQQATGQTICDCTDLGTSVTELMHRFGAPRIAANHGYAAALTAVAPAKG